jgi:hypothetical protein
MIRPLTFLCLFAAFGSGLYLYSEKHKAILLDRDIAHAIRGTEAARQRTGLLRAEWALLNDPGRLQDMADKYLTLKPMAPGQFVQLADLSTRLPAPVAPAPAGAEDAGQDDAAVASVDAPVARTSADAPVAGTSADAPVAVASPAVEPEPPVVVAKADPPHPASAHPSIKLARAAQKKPPHATAVASREPLPHDRLLTRGTMLPLAGLPPGGARIVTAMARPMRPAPRASVVTAYPSAIGSGTYVGSALATGSSLPPPVPFR